MILLKLRQFEEKKRMARANLTPRRTTRKATKDHDEKEIEKKVVVTPVSGTVSTMCVLTTCSIYT